MEAKTIKENIIDYAKNKYYFHINDLKKHLVEKNIKFKNDSLNKSIYRLNKERILYDAGRGWYSTIEKQFELNTKPLGKIITVIKKKFPLIEFSCWNTEQIKSYFHHLPSQFVSFVHADKDFLQTLKDYLTDNNYKVYLNPTKSETAKYVELGRNTIIMRPTITYRELKNLQSAKIESILVDLLMEIKKINLIDLEEYKKIVSNIVLNYHINMAELFDNADRRGIKTTVQKIIFDMT